MRSKFSFLMVVALLVVGLGGRNVASAAPSYVTAAELRALLDTQLGEHVLLAASATGAALGGRDAEFKAAADALDANSVDISKSIGLVYGAGAEQAFLPLWRKHIGFFVDYTNGAAKKDQAAKDKAIADLTQYAGDFGAFIESANPNLPKKAVADLLVPHVGTLTGAIDAQAAGDGPTAFKQLRDAYAHMGMISEALAGGIAKQFPDKFAGNASDSAAGLRSLLTNQINEHVFLAGMATGAATGGRDAEFKAAADALDANSVDLSKSIGSVYGAGAEQAFLPLWRKHIGFFVDYTNGAAKKDQAAKDKAIADLTQYAGDFGAFIESANPNLPKKAVADLLVPHVTTLTSAIDAQAAGDAPTAYKQLRAAYAHMPMIANALTDGIVKQFPDKFGGTPAAAPAPSTPAAPGTLPNTGAPTSPALYLLIPVIAVLVAGAAMVRRSRRTA